MRGGFGEAEDAVGGAVHHDGLPGGDEGIHPDTPERRDFLFGLHLLLDDLDAREAGACGRGGLSDEGGQADGVGGEDPIDLWGEHFGKGALEIGGQGLQEGEVSGEERVAEFAGGIEAFDEREGVVDEGRVGAHKFGEQQSSVMTWRMRGTMGTRESQWKREGRLRHNGGSRSCRCG
ncbi:MAG: hypothetical protein M5U12_31635 [Verrucomicrobia bacterium]|nr:hypothetical protein [Verrucomicrobiota bacterium]